MERIAKGATSGQAAVLRDAPGELVIEQIVVDSPGPREVLIRTVAAGLCHSDLNYLQGVFPIRTPLVMGHESAGVVEAIGSDVSSFEPGDHVVTCLSLFCGQCEFCLSGRPSLCDGRGLGRPRGATPRLTLDGESCGQFAGLASFAELMLVHEHAVVKIDREMPLDRAALLGCCVSTGIGSVLHSAQVEAGSTVAVLGCGGIGLNCLQGAALAGARRVIAIDTSAAKLELAVRFGATDLVDASQVDAVERVRELCPEEGRGDAAPPGGVDYAFEAVGRKKTVEQSFAMIRKGGTATIVGMLAPHEKIELSGTELMAEKRIQGSRMGSNRFRIDIPRYVELYLGGRLELDELISSRIGLEEIGDGFATLSDGHGARTVVMFE
jgi:S-(hydroxymethyl)glutathione dehydrogenase / alcohol dehydrogenase